jgi:hypothetical protein
MARARAKAAVALDGHLDLTAYFLAVDLEVRAVQPDVLLTTSSALNQLALSGVDDAVMKKLVGTTPWRGYEDLIAEAPQARFYYQRGLVKAWSARTTRTLQLAADDFEAALHIEPDSPYGDQGAGLCAALRGDGDGARSRWRAARAIDPSWCLPRDELFQVPARALGLFEEFGAK